MLVANPVFIRPGRGRPASFLSYSCDVPRIASPRPAAEHPPSRLTQAAASEVATGVYLGQATLDVNIYREAKAASALSDKEKQSQYEVAKAQQTRDVQACQNYFQQSEFVFDTGSWLSSIAIAGKWVPVCAGAARANSPEAAPAFASGGVGCRDA